ncbi:hypothetical protein DPMN_124329 [Dreissena polymorpha]|uniref:Uncharacterized protein n=1 Tax=Dreissena polymorpha TaxID=45954 RepID=A0A9D4F289_DREPO|nr:hypothetical protein DPMN_166462 [Dreissena polymorpha]KAH3822545.1 hypothetical protein DPMN_124329 [Dreissena polymorpha]
MAYRMISVTVIEITHRRHAQLTDRFSLPENITQNAHQCSIRVTEMVTSEMTSCRVLLLPRRSTRDYCNRTYSASRCFFIHPSVHTGSQR